MDMIPQDNAPRKRCTGICGRTLPATTEYFNTAKKGKYGLRAVCRECRQKQYQEYMSRPEAQQHRQEYCKEYSARPDVKEHIRERHKEYNKEYTKRPDVKERKKEYNREYIQRPDVKEHREEHRKEYKSRPEIKVLTQEQYSSYHARPDVIDRIQAYRARPDVKERYRIHVHTRRARVRSVGGTHTPEQIQDQLIRQKHHCYYCRKRLEKSHEKYIYHIEHVVPLSRGGSNDISNIVLTCPTCNLRKRNNLPHEWPEGGRLL